jgi:hypothetical protein
MSESHQDHCSSGAKENTSQNIITFLAHRFIDEQEGEQQ